MIYTDLHRFCLSIFTSQTSADFEISNFWHAYLGNIADCLVDFKMAVGLTNFSSPAQSARGTIADFAKEDDDLHLPKFGFSTANDWLTVSGRRIAERFCLRFHAGKGH